MAGFLFLGYLALLLVPLALAWSSGLPARGVMDELATGAGLVAMAIILVEFVLSGRFRRLTTPFGMDRMMRFHQLMARSAMVLVFVHPILYSTWQRAEAFDPTRQGFVVFSAAGLLPGIAAFLLLGAIIAMAMLRSDLGYRYEIWRFLHGLVAVGIGYFGVLHATLLGRYSADPVLEAFWWGLFAVAVLSLLTVYIGKPLSQLRRPWRVKAVDRAAERMWLVTLEPEGHAGLAYEAGQFAWVNFGHSPFSLSENPFSIASAPSDGPEIAFLIKELGDSTRATGSLAVGTRAYLDAPHGDLTVTGTSHPGVACIAGGVGLAPMLGILGDMAATGDRRPTALVYGNRTPEQIACESRLAALAAGGTEITHVLSEPPEGWSGESGFIEPALLRRLFGSDERRNWLFVLCGPPPMLQAVEDALIDIGVDAANIVSERFVYD